MGKEVDKAKSVFKEGFDVNNIRWSQGQVCSPHFTPADLTILRAYEWDRINFSRPEKRQRTAEEMGVSLEELFEIRRTTLLNAQKNVC